MHHLRRCRSGHSLQRTYQYDSGHVLAPPSSCHILNSLSFKGILFIFPQNFTEESYAFNLFKSSPRPISTSQLKRLLALHTWPIYLVIYKGPYQINSVRDLILRLVSRLDAFSVYPFRT